MQHGAASQDHGTSQHREASRRFLEEVIRPQASVWEASGEVPPSVWQRAAQEGLTRMLLPKIVAGKPTGGWQLGTQAATEVLSILGRGSMGFAFALVVHNNLTLNIARNGSPEQSARWLPPMRSGECLGAFCLTEPAAGTDAAAIRSRARRNADGSWHLQGEKAWVTNANRAGVFSVYAQTEEGMASFLVPRHQEGMHLAEPLELAGMRTLGCGELTLDAHLPADSLLLDPGTALQEALRGIDTARVLLASICCGMLTEALQLALERCRKREAFGRPLAEHQGLRWQLAEVSTELAAAEALMREAAAALDTLPAQASRAQRQRASLQAAHAKKFSTRAALRGIARCMQTMGAEALRPQYPLSSHLQCAKAAEYMDGTSEVQNIVIARALFTAKAPTDRG